MFYQVNRWLNGPRWIRAVSLVVLASAIIFLIDSFTLQPLKTQIQEYASKNQQESKKAVQARRELISLVSSLKSDDRRFIASPPRCFSIMDLLQHSGGKLEKWQPDNTPASLEIVLGWEKLPLIFLYFSHYGNLTLHAFNLEPKGEKLKLTVIMDIADES